ncbi:hypothetical protein E8P82_13330 [Arthrobacter echini]|uniref:Alpha/beta hydrolase n=1 Tax=Arthrobacter echini TaxID=1529066 RepID=A0A4S5E0Y0_9MICC|nr:hypothetical protein [Arthrobacter echini]THJ64967.1 hypothetical protein E8P82_13330 [Arthrobacter echini]
MSDHDVGAWDQTYNVPLLPWQPTDPPESLPDHPVHLETAPGEPDRLYLHSLYEPAPTETLIVSMHGALNRSRFTPPRFEWRRTLNRVDCARLFLSDSTLELNGSLEIGWYMGSARQDLLSEYAALVRAVAAAKGYTRIVCVGSSAGGFGALALSRQVPNSVAVVFSPQTSIAAYHPGHRRALAEASFAEYATDDAIESAFGDRVNMRLLYKNSLDRNYVHYVQNTRDRFHYEAHYVPFALSFGVDPEAGGSDVGRRISFHPERQDEGHSPPSRSRFLKHIGVAYRQYYGTELVVQPRETDQGKALGNR